MQRVTISCPQGIQRLTELGRAVARQKAWQSHSRAHEAWVGLWTDCALTRAELRGQAETIEARIQADANPSDFALSSDAAMVDHACKLWLDFAERAARQQGATAADQVSVTITLPKDAGAWPLAVTVAVIAGVAALGVVVAWKNIETVQGIMRRYQAASTIASGAATALDIADRCREQQRECTEDERAIMRSTLAASEQAANQMSRPEESSSGLGWTGLLLAAGAAAVLLLRD